MLASSRVLLRPPRKSQRAAHCSALSKNRWRGQKIVGWNADGASSRFDKEVKPASRQFAHDTSRARTIHFAGNMCCIIRFGRRLLVSQMDSAKLCNCIHTIRSGCRETSIHQRKGQARARKEYATSIQDQTLSELSSQYRLAIASWPAHQTSRLRTRPVVSSKHQHGPLLRIQALASN